MELGKRGLEFVKSHWYLFVLLAIVIISFWVRSMPARFGELQALDPFYLYRASEYVLENNWQLNPHDVMRYYPTGVSHWEVEFLVPIYMPTMMYAMLSALGMNMHYLHFAIIFPAILGALSVLVVFFLVREFFKDKKLGMYAGLFSALFLATVPAFITRTSAGFFEKESLGLFFMLLSIYLFLKALRRGSWRYGILSGLALAVGSGSWGGLQFVYLLYSGFIVLLFAINIILALLDYLFPNKVKELLSDLEGFLGLNMVKAFVPTILFSLLHTLAPRSIEVTSYVYMLSFFVAAVLLIKYGIGRFNLVRKDYLPYVIPAIVVIGFLGLLLGSMFFDPLTEVTNGLFGMFSPQTGVVDTTVAENNPGNWDHIISVTNADHAMGIVPYLGFLIPYLSVWVFMFLGIALLAYRFYRTRNWIYLLLLFWGITTIYGVFRMVRLAILLGPPAAILAGFFVGWVIYRMPRVNIFEGKRVLGMKPLTTLVLVFVVLVFVVNIANGYNYSRMLGPSICFPQENKPCIVIGQGGELIFDEDQPWYQAMTFLSEQTPEDTVVLSWWDFGYWFQTRGNRASVADGGNMYYSIVYNIADWFTDNVGNWSAREPWLEYHGVNYILMDYSLPGKYGAISKIASRGEDVKSIIQLDHVSSYPNENGTVEIFKSGPYEIWVSFTQDGSITSSPMFLVTQGGQYMGKSHINRICSSQGIAQVGNEEDDIGGCVAFSSLGVFYLDGDTYGNIFSSLMFMDGAGLPVDKEFDNGYIKIYKTTSY